MCLHTLDKETKKFEYGWKIFLMTKKKKLLGLYHTPCINAMQGYPVNKWISDTEGIIKENFPLMYLKGFHFYKTRDEARRMKGTRTYPFSGHRRVIRKIKVRNIVASGTQTYCRVGVAKEMLILEEVK